MSLCRIRSSNGRLYLIVSLIVYASSIGSASTQHEALHPKSQQDQPPLSSAAATSDHQQHEQQQLFTNQSQGCTQGAASFLLSNRRTDKLLDETDPIDLILSNVLKRLGPDTRPTAGFRDPQDITVEVAKRAWLLMRQHALATAAGQVEFYRPIVEQILINSNVSTSCLSATQRVADAARRLESWSIQLLNSWGSFPPAGLFEGTLADIGSFHGCVNVPENSQINHAHYCTLAYRPVMPTRKDYELIIRQEPRELLELFNNNDKRSHQQQQPNHRDSFSDLINKAQYSHYVYFKLGTCFPIDCTPFDVQKIAQLLGRSAILVSGPVKCHSKFQNDYEYDSCPSSQSSNNSHAQLVATTSANKKLELSIKDLNEGIYIWKPHITRTQLVSLIIICLLIGWIILMSFIDLALTLQAYLERTIEKENESRMSASRGSSIGEYVAVGSVIQLRDVAKKVDEEEEGKEEVEEGDPNNNVDGSDDPTAVCLKTDQPSKQSDAEQRQSMLMIDSNEFSANKLPTGSNQRRQQQQQQQSTFLNLIRDCSIIRNTQEFFLIGTSQQKNDILCLNGLRCITMSWIIVQHTMQYNDWSAFARIYEIETHLESLIMQPIFNGSYLVDTFFLISGLLTSFSVFKINPNTNSGLQSKQQQQHHSSIKQILNKFSCKSYLIGRYLRLTPQILLVSLLFICLPLMSRNGSPHWYTMTGEYSENCARNWWINLFHIQAFYKSNEMCNFVCWWISVDMLYHSIALLIILTILRYGRKISFRMYSVLILTATAWQASQHYQMKLPPNLLSTIPQTGLMWSEMILNYFWLPKAHSFPFLLGFYLGYSMAQSSESFRKWFTVKRALLGWLATISTMVLILYSTHFWVIGTVGYSPAAATSFHLITQVIWSFCLSWIICACQFDHGGFINQILSCKLFIILGKASYIVYLSHFLVLFTFFGSQNLLLEPTQILMTYVIMGNVCLSMLFGSLLCIVFEMPWLKLQRRIMRKIR